MGRLKQNVSIGVLWSACTLLPGCLSAAVVGEISEYVKTYAPTRIVSTGITVSGIGGTLQGALRGAQLPDGRIYFSGSGFNQMAGGSQNIASIYDPLTNTNTSLSSAFSAYNRYGGHVTILINGSSEYLGLSAGMTTSANSLAIQNIDAGNTGTLEFVNDTALAVNAVAAFSSDDLTKAWFLTGGAVQEVNAAGTVVQRAPRAQAQSSASLRLSGDRILSTGGLVSGTVSTVNSEIYQSSNNTWVSAPDLQLPRRTHAIASLGGNRFLIAGGQATNITSTAYDSLEIMDLNLGTTRLVTARMTTPRTYPCAIQIADGRVLIAGGLDADGNRLDTTEFFDPETEKITVGPVMPGPMGLPQCFPYDGGKKVILGFGNQSSAESALYRFETY
jgi:hypothetical protein